MAFEDIIGHDRQKRFLKFFLENKNIPHSFLFCGQEGIGKKKTAREFVRHLFCQTGNACGTCRPCVKLDRGSHPDLVIIENERSIGIDDSRMISKEISEHPFESEKRVIIIDNAETMTTEAANALLKTIEEPPPYNHFFIITSSERDIPMTIRSRCMRVPFSLLSAAQLEHYFRSKKKYRPEEGIPSLIDIFRQHRQWPLLAQRGTFFIEVKVGRYHIGQERWICRFLFCRRNGLAYR